MLALGLNLDESDLPADPSTSSAAAAVDDDEMPPLESAASNAMEEVD